MNLVVFIFKTATKLPLAISECLLNLKVYVLMKCNVRNINILFDVFYVQFILCARIVFVITTNQSQRMLWW